MSCVKCDANQRDRQGRLCRYCSWKPPAEPSSPSPTARARAGADANPADIGVLLSRLGATNQVLDQAYDLMDRLQKQAYAAGRARGIEEGKEAVETLRGTLRDARSRWIEISCARTLTDEELAKSRACDNQLRKWERIADAIAKETGRG